MKQSEMTTDIWVAKMLEKAEVNFTTQKGPSTEINNALEGASKSGKGGTGKPDFICVVKDFLIVIENKNDTNLHIKYDENNLISLNLENGDVKNYAVNGSLHYANHLLEKTNFKKIFAFGVSGDEKHHRITPIFVDENGYKTLEDIKNFENFSEDNIERYYEEMVLGKTPKEQIEQKEIIDKAKKIHEDLWKYGALKETEKPLVVSAILLALEDENFRIENLIGSQTQTDGKKIIDSLNNYLDEVEVKPEDKKKAILYNFAFIQNSRQLNTKNSYLQKTPLKYFAEIIKNDVKGSIHTGHSEDILGKFYSEFVKYGGGDGQNLGIVLTPKHITDMFCELLHINKDDIVFDPCCGTAAFLIAAMHHMVQDAGKDTEKIKHILQHQLHGTEIKDDMFTIATTNMILRGDGKSNLKRANFLEQRVEDLQKIKATVGLMNPPYSQSKDRETRHLSELSFISHLLESMVEGGRVAVIVPQSTMIGKTKEDKQIKKQIYEKHSIESVITLNTNTFYGIGVNPCIAIFIAHKPHNPEKRVKFFNFEDDGYVVSKHIGLVETPRAISQKKLLLDAFFDREDPETKFMVKTKIEPDDEWLHSFYYFNDEIPTEADFEKTMADYLTFEFDMITHGRGYLFDNTNEYAK